MREASTFRLYLLRASYLLLVVGLGLDIWPGILHPPAHVEHMRGVVKSVLGAISLLAIVGLRYPVKMLPLLFFELTWKVIWVISIGLPLWSSNQFDVATRDTWNSCLFGLVVFAVVIPWGYVLRHYFIESGDRWRRAPDSVPRSNSAVEGAPAT